MKRDATKQLGMNCMNQRCAGTMILGANLCTKAPGKSIEFGQTHSEIKRSAIIFPPILPSLYVGLSENQVPVNSIG